MADFARVPLSMSAAPAAVVIDARGHRSLVATERIAAGEEILPLRGVVHPAPTRFSIQIGLDRHMDGMGPVDATNHSCEPSAFVDFSDARRLVLRALRGLAPGDEVTIHYCATEYDMSSPFTCGCGAEDCVGIVRGYRHLPAATARALEPRISPVIRELLGRDEEGP